MLRMTLFNSNFFAIDGVLHFDDQILASPGLKRAELDRGFGHHVTARESAPDFIVYGPVTIQL